MHGASTSRALCQEKPWDTRGADPACGLMHRLPPQEDMPPPSGGYGDPYGGGGGGGGGGYGGMQQGGCLTPA